MHEDKKERIEFAHTNSANQPHTLFSDCIIWLDRMQQHTHTQLWESETFVKNRFTFGHSGLVFFLSVSHDCVLFSSLSLFRLAILFSLLLAFSGCCCLPKQKMAWRCSRAIRPSPKSKQRVSISINENRLQRQNWLMITNSHTSHSSFCLCEDLVFSSYFIIDLWSNICIGFRVLWSHKIRIPLQENVMPIEIWSSHQFKPTTQWHFSTSCTAIECVYVLQLWRWVNEAKPKLLSAKAGTVQSIHCQEHIHTAAWFWLRASRKESKCVP